MGNRNSIGQVTTPAPSAAYLAFYPCLQASTDTTVQDRSGKGNHATLGALTLGEAWGVSNYLSSLDSSDKAARAAVGMFSGWTSSRSLLVSVRATVTKEGAQATLWGNGAGGLAHSGLALRVAASGALSFWGYKSDNTSASTGTTTETPFATAAEHDIGVAYDGAAKTVVIYIDGVRSTNYSTPSDVSAWIDLCDDNLIDPMFLGGRVSADTVAGKYQYWHFLSRAGALPSNIDEIMVRLRQNPATPLSEYEFGA